MASNDILKEARIQAGMSVADAAATAGISLASYYDLEECEADIEAVFSISELFNICKILSLCPLKLYPNSLDAKVDTAITLRYSLLSKFSESRLSLEEFSNSVGWDVGIVFTDPFAVWEYPIWALKDLCNATDINWLSVYRDLYYEWSRQYH